MVKKRDIKKKPKPSSRAKPITRTQAGITKPVPSSSKSKTITQSQNVIINLPSRTSKPRTQKTQEQPKQYLPLMPSFNINPAQPQPISDLAKVLGMLIPKVQTESTLGSSIPTKSKVPEKPKVNIGGLIDVKDTPSLADAIASKIDEKPIETEPILPEKTIELEEEPYIEVKPVKKPRKPRKPKQKQPPIEEPLFGITSAQLEPIMEKEKEKEGEPQFIYIKKPKVVSQLNIKAPKKPRQKKQMAEQSTPILENYYAKENLDKRYESAFGEPYTGSANIKASEFKKMILERESINK
jgi:hypothetical protein